MACREISERAVVSSNLRVASYRVHGRSDEYDLLFLVDARVRVPGADDGGEEVVGHAVDDLCWRGQLGARAIATTSLLLTLARVFALSAVDGYSSSPLG